MQKIVLSVLTVIVFAYIVAAILLYCFQRHFLYFPSPVYPHPYERFSVDSQGETLEVIMLNPKQEKALVYFGGNAEAVVASAEALSLALPNITVYLVNYRGYGGSSGEPTEEGIYADALAVYDAIDHHHSGVSVAGRSLGSGVATYLAVQRSIDRMVLITPYDSVLNVAKRRFSFFPVGLLLKDRYDSLSRSHHLEATILVITAEEDRVIPVAHTQRLVNALASNEVLSVTIPQSGHNTLSNHALYYQALSDFL